MINVLCELIAKNDPLIYIKYMPQIVNIMSNCSNNWMLIKIFKIYGMCLEFDEQISENGFSKKIADFCINNLQSTTAMSLMYQCSDTALQIIALGPDSVRGRQAKQLINLCVEKLKFLINANDQNLRYLGLYSLSNLDEISRIYTDYESLLRCVDECQDESICTRAIACLLRIADTNIITSLIRKITPQIRGIKNDTRRHPDYYHNIISELMNKLDTLGFENLNSDWLACAILELSAVDDQHVYHPSTINRLASALMETVTVASSSEGKIKVAKRCAQYLFNWPKLVVKSDSIWIVSKWLDCLEMREKFLVWLLRAEELDWTNLLTAMDMQCDMNQMSVGSIEKLNVLAGSSGLSEFERDLQQLFPVIGVMNEKQGMSPVGYNFDESDIGDLDLEECVFEVKIDVKKQKVNQFEKQQASSDSQSPQNYGNQNQGNQNPENNNYEQTNVKPSISGSTHATYTTIPASPSLSSVTSKENINYLGSTPKEKNKTKQSLFNEQMNEKLIPDDDPFANINPLDGVDASKLPKKNKLPMQAKKLPKKTKLVNLFQDERIRVKVQIDGDDMTLKLQNLTESVLWQGCDDLNNRGDKMGKG